MILTKKKLLRREVNVRTFQNLVDVQDSAIKLQKINKNINLV
jgi:hypothetical protein